VAVACGRRSARRQAAQRRDGAAASEAAIQEAKPMSGNAYKIQITRTAVKRAIMNAAGLKTV
jgi:CO/xanthine dehydrogenase FAD-binding subunit